LPRLNLPPPFPAPPAPPFLCEKEWRQRTPRSVWYTEVLGAPSEKENRFLPLRSPDFSQELTSDV